MNKNDEIDKIIDFVKKCDLVDDMLDLNELENIIEDQYLKGYIDRSLEELGACMEGEGYREELILILNDLKDR